MLNKNLTTQILHYRRHQYKKSLMKYINSLLFLVILLPISSYGKEKIQPEYKLKAVFLVSFLKFVSWPQRITNDDTIRIGIVGDDPFENYFNPVEDIRIAGKKVVIKRFGRFKQGQKLHDCQLLFISDSEKRNTRKIAQRLTDHPVLAVSDRKYFLEDNGMIYLFIEHGKLRFDVNLNSIKNVGLKIDSRLLRYARKVIRD